VMASNFALSVYFRTSLLHVLIEFAWFSRQIAVGIFEQ